MQCLITAEKASVILQKVPLLRSHSRLPMLYLLPLDVCLKFTPNTSEMIDSNSLDYETIKTDIKGPQKSPNKTPSNKKTSG